MKRAEKVLQDWLNALNAGDVEKLLLLYNEKSLLIPTFSDRIIKSGDKRRDYFEKLKKRDNLSVTLHDKTVIFQQMSETIFGISGIYCWHFSIEDEPLSFEARFSYLVDVSLPHPILHHHSSQIPRTL